MKRVLMWGLLCVLNIGFLSITTYSFNFGRVELSRIFKEYEKAIEGLETTKDRRKEYEDYVTEKSQPLVDEYKNPQRDLGRLKNLERELDNELRPMQQLIIEEEQLRKGEILAEVLEAIKEIQEEYNLEAVFESRSIISGGLDITDLVLDKLSENGN